MFKLDRIYWAARHEQKQHKQHRYQINDFYTLSPAMTIGSGRSRNTDIKNRTKFQQHRLNWTTNKQKTHLGIVLSESPYGTSLTNGRS